MAFSRSKSAIDIFEPSIGTEDSPVVRWGGRRGNNSHALITGRRRFRSITVESFSDFRRDRSMSDLAARFDAVSLATAAASTDDTTTASEVNKGRHAGSVIQFHSGNPFVEVTKGMLHLYRENEKTSLEEGVIRSPMLCMLSVPTKLKSADLIQFTAPYHASLEVMRIVQDAATPNYYMVLLRFCSQEAADDFYATFSGQQFNSFDRDICQLAYVSRVEMCKQSHCQPLMPNHTELPVCSICLERMDESISLVLTVLCNHSFHGSCLAQWEDSTCPVCRHVQTPEVVAEQRCSDAHCNSSTDLWICLICGYVGCGRYVGGHARAHFEASQHCYTMELGKNRVWDYVGDNFVHRLIQAVPESGDDLTSKIVEAEAGSGGPFDIRQCQMCSGRIETSVAGDDSDQNIEVLNTLPICRCEHQAQNQMNSGVCSGNASEKGVDSDKLKLTSNPNETKSRDAKLMDSLELEYTYLLTSQMETQKRYFEKIIAQMETSWEAVSDELRRRNDSLTDELNRLTGVVEYLQTERARWESKHAAMANKLRDALRDWHDEKEINKCLTANQAKYQERMTKLEMRLAEQVSAKDAQITDLQEQLRDMMFYMEAQSTIAKSDMADEIAEGHVTVGEQAGPSGRRKHKKKGGDQAKR